MSSQDGQNNGTPPSPSPERTQALSTNPGAQVVAPSAFTPQPSAPVWSPATFPPPAPEPEAGVAQGAPEPEPGEHVRQYELIRRLGRGGMGEVFLARDTKLDRRVAIKFPHTEDPALVQRFVIEARTTASCSHENIVTLYEADTYQGRPYMVLEFLQGPAVALMALDQPAETYGQLQQAVRYGPRPLQQERFDHAQN